MPENTPVILCHAACTGGSMIYRLMVSTFGFSGLAEIGHGRRTTFGFSPLDPEAQMFSLGQIDHQEFGSILAGRLINANKLANQNGKRLLVREHTHSYFFNPDVPEVIPKGPSWIADRFEQEIGDKPHVVVTVRDPVDSWLGLRRHFNHLKPDRFEDYCQIYNQFFDRVEDWQKLGNPVHVFKYEDCVVDPETTMSELARFLKLEYTGLDVSAAFNTASSGNSGRQSASLSLRKRRPFTMKLVNATRDNAEYNKLCSRLGYEPFHSSLTAAGRRSAMFYSMLSPLGKIGSMAEKPGRWIYSLIKSGEGLN